MHPSAPTWTALVIVLLLAITTAWWTTDALEADNDFCNRCHLPNGRPLHTDIRDDFDGRPPASLAARHASADLPDRPDDPDFRCIDCHGGVGLAGRAGVKLLSIWDSTLYLTGHFQEPDGMRWPLRDASCARCHPSFERKGSGFDGEAFHDRPGHNQDLGVDCVACHEVHASDARADLWFLRPDAVRARCAECHVEYESYRKGGDTATRASAPPATAVARRAGPGDRRDRPLLPVVAAGGSPPAIGVGSPREGRP
jgi:hypothetical protein